MMILYHYTAKEYLEEILRDGLTKGDVPVSPTEGMNAVWLTTDHNSEGHGLSDGEFLTPELRDAYARVCGHEPPGDLRIANKRAVRIKVMISTLDRRLEHWPSWARKRLDRGWYQTLDAVGGGKSASWYLYFAGIAPERFLEVDLLTR